MAIHFGRSPFKPDLPDFEIKKKDSPSTTVFEKFRHGLLKTSAEVEWAVNPKALLPDTLKTQVVTSKLEPYEVSGQESEIEKEYGELKSALSSYLKEILSSKSRPPEVRNYLNKASKLLVEYLGQGAERENLPLLLSHLLTDLSSEEADFFAPLCPFFSNGLITLDLNKNSERKIAEAVETRRKGKDETSRLTSFFSYFNPLSYISTPSDKVTLADLRSYFSTKEEMRSFLESYLTEKASKEPQKTKDFLGLISLPKMEEEKKEEPSLLFLALSEVVIPKVVDRLLKDLETVNFSKMIESTAETLKDHLEGVNKTEKEIDQLRLSITWMRQALLETDGPENLRGVGEKNAFALKVWRKELFSLPLEERRAFLNDIVSREREENYLKETRYQFLGIKIPSPIDDELNWARTALLHHKIPKGREHELQTICQNIWGIPLEELRNFDPIELGFVFREPIYKKLLTKQMGVEISRMISTYAAHLITPKLMLEVVKEIKGMGQDNPLSLLEANFPPLADLERQLESFSQGETPEGPSTLIHFIPFIEQGLPHLVKGMIQQSLNQKMVSEVISTERIEGLLAESILPAATDAMHGLLLQSLFNQNLDQVAAALLNPALFPALKAKIATAYEEIARREGLEIPKGMDAETILTGMMVSLQDNLKTVIKNLPEGTTEEKQVALREALKVYDDSNPSEEKNVYPELIFSALFAFSEFPIFLRDLLTASPLYPFAGSMISTIVTKSLYPYTKSHREVVRKTTDVIHKLQASGENRPIFQIRIPLKEQVEIETLNGRLKHNLEVEGEIFDGSMKVEGDELILTLDVDPSWLKTHREETPRDLLTQIGFEDLLGIADEKALDTPLQKKILSDKIKTISQTALTLLKVKIGIGGPDSYSGYVFKILNPEPPLTRLIDRLVSNALLRDPAYHYQLVGRLAKMAMEGGKNVP